MNLKPQHSKKTMLGQLYKGKLSLIPADALTRFATG
jgi:hypothetical protein